ncbi:hypothetical protein E5D57_013010 [Metarhizium anisopliae]|nr:hypothetical protein E5D57_013010 [Metarhizium anisopliae]
MAKHSWFLSQDFNFVPESEIRLGPTRTRKHLCQVIDLASSSGSSQVSKYTCRSFGAVDHEVRHGGYADSHRSRYRRPRLTHQLTVFFRQW